MLAEEMRRYLQKSNVRYYYLSTTEALENVCNRSKITKYFEWTPYLYGGEYCDNSDIADIHEGNEYNIVNHKRFTVAQPKKFIKRVLIYGPCTAFGNWGDDAETIASRLHSLFNENDMQVKVINCGSNGGIGRFGEYSDINILYHILDSHFQSDDVVIHIGLNCWRVLPEQTAPWHYSMKQILDIYTHCYEIVSSDYSSAHILKNSYKIVTEFLYDKLKPILTAESPDARRRVPPFFKTLIDANILPPPRKILLYPNILQNYRKSA